MLSVLRPSNTATKPFAFAVSALLHVLVLLLANLTLEVTTHISSPTPGRLMTVRIAPLQVDVNDVKKALIVVNEAHQRSSPISRNQWPSRIKDADLRSTEARRAARISQTITTKESTKQSPLQSFADESKQTNSTATTDKSVEGSPGAIETQPDNMQLILRNPIQPRGSSPQIAPSVPVSVAPSTPSADALGRSIRKSTRSDCANKYAVNGLLAIPLIAADYARDDGCRFKQ
jgi:hypothetical protein